MQNANKAKLSEMQRLLKIMAQLRDPQSGCPWDVKQTMESLTRYTIEEAYEVADAIANGDMHDIKDELGDLLFQVVFYAQIASESRAFSFDDVAKSISDKLVRRHPHVFANALASEGVSDTNENVTVERTLLSDSALNAQWDAIKAQEKQLKKQRLKQDSEATENSILDNVPKGMPALMYAQKLQKACAKVGFDWSDAAPVIDKVREEVEEIQQELDFKQRAQGALKTGVVPLNSGVPDNQQAIEEEIGDALFAMVNLARHCKVDADTALRNASNKFANRFKGVERLAAEQGDKLDALTLDEMEALWQQVKQSSSSNIE
ncbi:MULTISPECIES: nucleoside triphosphate pyrophosphohydrolase [Alteromonas]|uniref:nucleoside triphosphate pyrophosphohydrolase n=1 Tax=Alteromonas TaxID=226 RepID=UPI00066AD061|nr:MULTISPECIES: nucleoside triphosphate pyrophosphohydrolase [Alteromonas]MCG7649421.1 nucleoside triphosphate pyrophosphohydrolase [Alteromonas sp. MmMcT2-5]NKX21580.1 nucleoside triphosphate pyrophosphohydrolase [Alteromonadaceae bacterium A_SAG2]CAI3936380.1 ATP diphosphatase [Alteromonas macleodii]VTP50773.1 ATP diphosphatase [Alteromonas macleodii]|tara:strand:- start:9701 stop:10657 length:957 start_codon:yes stop_codon:yes gene_type:complete